MNEVFTGFSRNTFDFLRDLSENNSKEWFELHKPQYQEHLLRPLQELVAALGPALLEIDPDFEVVPAVNRTISRIHRDCRFSRDKSPYKTSHWITFKRRSNNWQEFPAYFFELSPDSYRYGMGFYRAGRPLMERLREQMLSRPKPFLAAISFHGRPGCPFEIEGEMYRRPLCTDLPAHLAPWYNRKNLYLVHNCLVAGDRIEAELAAEVTQGFGTLAPLYRYFCKVAA